MVCRLIMLMSMEIGRMSGYMIDSGLVWLLEHSSKACYNRGAIKPQRAMLQIWTCQYVKKQRFYSRILTE